MSVMATPAAARWDGTRCLCPCGDWEPVLDARDVAAPGWWISDGGRSLCPSCGPRTCGAVRYLPHAQREAA